MNDPLHEGDRKFEGFSGGFLSEARKQKIRNQKEIREYFLINTSSGITNHCCPIKIFGNLRQKTKENAFSHPPLEGGSRKRACLQAKLTRGGASNS